MAIGRKVRLLIVAVLVFTLFAALTVVGHAAPEIEFVDGVPVFPNVRPVVIVSGSDYEMGYQYAQQISQIFGNWLLEVVPSHFTAEQLNVLKAYQWYIDKFAPEMIGFFKGMAAGATDVGVPLTYEEVLAQFATTVMHEEGFPAGAESETLPPEDDRCSGFAAWGSATVDGNLVAAGSSDGSDYFAVTLVFLPDEGNSFIWLIYEAVDTYLGIGGQPALNEKGLVYVHHGATRKAGRMGRETRYGLQSGTAIWHTLRYANTAQEAVDLQLSYDCTGWGWYGTGGFWADKDGNAFIIEQMEPPIVIREAGDLEEKDFLYSTNTLLSPELGETGQIYVPHAGWTTEGSAPNSSISRNLELWHMLTDYHGQIDFEFAKMMWRYAGSPVPVDATPENWDKVAKAHYDENLGAGWGYTIGRDTNAVIGIVLPSDLLYYVSTGYAQQAPNTGEPTSMHGQRYQPYATRAFYQLKLESTPEGVAAAAKYQSEIDLFFANRELRKLTYHFPAYAPLDELYNKALVEWTKGDHYQLQASKATEDQQIYWWAKAARAFTRCQVLARQVYNALVTPATTPEDLGLAPYTYGPCE